MDPQTLLDLFDETAALFHRLRAAAGQAHGQGELSAARRGVLRSIESHGPLTVPAMARMRPVSRQHIQLIVDSLAGDGLVQSLPNPAHRRSSLIGLTRKGAALIASMRKREWKMLKAADWPLSERAVKRAAAVLRQVRKQLDHLPEM